MQRWLFLLAALFFSCRPAGYTAPPAEPDPDPRLPDDMSQLPKEEFVHVALYGADSAPKSVMKAPDSADTLPSGLATLTLRTGTGQRPPREQDTVILHWVGWDSSGNKFDSSVDRGKPDRMRVQGMMPGLAEGIQQMVVGEKRRLWIPERIAYGPVPSPGRPAGDLVLEVELLEVLEPPKTPDVPKDLTEPPKDAMTTASGLRTKILRPGTGKEHPQRTDSVLVHYSGWSQDGQMFDSSVVRGEPISFGVDQVIPGWTEALMLMVEGERRRVWIPASLAYGETPSRPGVPAGPLVFDVELIEIQR